MPAVDRDMSCIADADGRTLDIANDPEIATLVFVGCVTLQHIANSEFEHNRYATTRKA